eukprot:TRINITY_DN4778_c0_g1_i1.p1 TRINITY_DN4778_c0_g1~~TRINITY_DN4778_c0_g1_i1.p1  ORF type:complete len:107 (-),score=9.02 TRINITY_DN4778_c0_g1_i1:123-443(-)
MCVSTCQCPLAAKYSLFASLAAAVCKCGNKKYCSCCATVIPGTFFTSCPLYLHLAANFFRITLGDSCFSFTLRRARSSQSWSSPQASCSAWTVSYTHLTLPTKRIV